MKLEGTIEQFPLRELIEMVFYSSVTGVISIYGARGCGQIFFRDGQPYHADYGDLNGLAAVGAMFEELSAKFSFVSDTTCDDETLWGDPLDLVDQAERLAARWRVLRPHITSLAMVPRRLFSPEAVHYRVDPAHWSYFLAIDGQHTLEELATLLNCEPIDLCEAVVQLCKDGLIELRRSSVIVPKAEGPPATVPLSNHGGLFDRLLGALPSVTPPRAEGGTNADAPQAQRAAGSLVHSQKEEAILRLLRG